jgi:hypothetical protein
MICSETALTLKCKRFFFVTVIVINTTLFFRAVSKVVKLEEGRSGTSTICIEVLNLVHLFD